jgi:hypothetical protein
MYRIFGGRILGGLARAVGAWGPGDDGLGAQQELRAAGRTAESGRVDGRVCLDAGAAICDGVCDGEHAGHVSGRARGCGGGWDQHGFLGRSFG